MVDDAGMGARRDTDVQPHLASGDLYRRARRIAGFAQIIMDVTGGSQHRADAQRAAALMQEIGALAGFVADREGQGS